jgi:uncharacterized protein YlxW (UPF0749 family)
VPTDSERMATLEERVRSQGEMLRALSRLSQNSAEMGVELRNAREDIGDLSARVEQLSKTLEREQTARRDGQEARLRESKTNRTLIAVAAIGLFGTFLSSLAAVLVVVM